MKVVDLDENKRVESVSCGITVLYHSTVIVFFGRCK